MAKDKMYPHLESAPIEEIRASQKMKEKVKVLEASSPRDLELKINDFLDLLPYDPKEIQYGTSFVYREDIYEQVKQFPVYTAYIRYRQPYEWRNV